MPVERALFKGQRTVRNFLIMASADLSCACVPEWSEPLVYEYRCQNPVGKVRERERNLLRDLLG